MVAPTLPVAAVRRQSSAFVLANPCAYDADVPLKIDRAGRGQRGVPAGVRRTSSAGVGGRRPSTSDGLRGGARALRYQRPFDLAYSELAMQRNLKRIYDLFTTADNDGSGTLDLGELQLALRDHQMRRSFAAVGVQPHQAKVVFDAFDDDRDGELTLEDFMAGLSCIAHVHVDGSGVDLDIQSLRAANRRKALEEGRERWAAVLRETQKTLHMASATSLRLPSAAHGSPLAAWTRSAARAAALFPAHVKRDAACAPQRPLSASAASLMSSTRTSP
mmetsp:Transcript_123472/g.357013  ORF Transcript_123472/g.357013 Transcript_123472/m.357013 type:complete len:275 (+) Transcript_123472:75-899(+)